MSPWEACHTIPNTSKQAAARIGEFFKGNPLNLKGLVFLNMDQLKSAFKSMNMDFAASEKVMGKETMLTLGGVSSNGKVRLLRIKWKKEVFQLLVSVYEEPGNMPMVTIIGVPNWQQVEQSDDDDDKAEDYYPYAIS